jgi:glycosyltransferase involved in cell wall biosynthesis
MSLHNAQALAVLEWLQGNQPAYCAVPVGAGDWLFHFTETIRQAHTLANSWLPHPGPWQLWPRQDRFELLPLLHHPSLAATVFYPAAEESVGIRHLWRWFRSGARAAWFLEGTGWKECDILGLLTHRILCKGARAFPSGLYRWLNQPRMRTRVMMAPMRITRRYGPPIIVHAEVTNPLAGIWEKRIAADKVRPSRIRSNREDLKIVQYLGALFPGGAERQLCNLAVGLLRRGHEVRVHVQNDLKGECGHYAALLKRHRVPLLQASAYCLTSELAETLPWHLLAAVPPEVRQAVVNLAAELAIDQPDVLHCWLDQPNVIGFMAGMIADVPCVILSTRNSNPTNFPRLNLPYLQDWYRLAAQSRRVHFIANSRSGAASYADWIGVPVERFHLVFNGVDLGLLPEPTPASRCRARAALGCKASDRVISGVFRLAEEKQPDLFLDVIHRVRLRVPHLRVLLVGNGDLETHVAQRIASEGLADCVRLLGRRSDVATTLLASDVNLLTSKLEGTPNIALETQYLGTPIVATSGGGTVDAVLDGTTGFLTGVRDAETLADRVTQILLDHDLRERLASAGPKFVMERFVLDGMINRTLAVYDHAFGSALTQGSGEARVA